MQGTEELHDRLVSAKAYIEEVIDLLNVMELPINNRKCTCIDCLNWDSKTSMCGVYKCVPPPVVIAGIGHCEQRCLDLPF